MRLRSVYEVQCECGAVHQSEGRVITCDKCGRVLELHWRDEVPEAAAACAH